MTRRGAWLSFVRLLELVYSLPVCLLRDMHHGVAKNKVQKNLVPWAVFFSSHIAIPPCYAYTRRIVARSGPVRIEGPKRGLTRFPLS